MRDIKFRAWDKRTKRLYQVQALQFYGTNNTVDACWTNGVDFDGESTLGEPELNNLNNLVLMQYTGLKDSNGVEIYEGDILQSEHYFKYQVVFKGDCWRCESLKNSRFKNRFIGRDLTVIGNIWEDGDLIDSERTKTY
ncbi:YopX family protein [Jeotgalibaca porci]|uniref:YopX family protein n=3 Tax=Jeotgalibaca porci TaxID=1868793 RepID=UPI0035A0CA67